MKDFDTPRFSFEKNMEAKTSRFQGKLDVLEKQLVDEYDNKITFYYDCIIFILGKEYPELDMSRLEAGVDDYMNEHNEKSNEQKEAPQNVQKSSMGTEEAAPTNDEGSQAASNVDQTTKVVHQIMKAAD